MKKSLQIILFINFIFVGFTVAQSDIKEVDFKNFTFQPHCGNAQPQNMTVSKGLFYEEKQIPQVPDKKQKTPPAPVYERKYFKPYEFIYSDINGDEINEAIILTTCSSGGIESYSEAFIYGMKDGNPSMLARIEGGDRALGGLRNIKVENNIIIVERSRPGFTNEACCAESVETTRYQFTDGALTQTGEKNTYEIYAPTRLQFAEGMNKTSVNLNIPRSDEFKRFVISGQKGQKLIISTTSKDARVRLFKGNAKILLNPKPLKKLSDYIAQDILTADLKENGDYIFEVSNLSKENVDLDVTVTVEIN